MVSYSEKSFQDGFILPKKERNGLRTIILDWVLRNRKCYATRKTIHKHVTTNGGNDHGSTTVSRHGPPRQNQGFVKDGPNKR